MTTAFSPYIEMEEADETIQTNKHPKGCLFALWTVALLLMLLIIAASWVPDSRMTALRWVPAWAAEWADRDPNIRTAIPFIPLAFLLVHGFAWRGYRWPLGWSVILCCLCLGLSELGQVFLPSRTADVADLMWGGIGVLVGAVLAWGMSHWRKKVEC